MAQTDPTVTAPTVPRTTEATNPPTTDAPATTAATVAPTAPTTRRTTTSRRPPTTAAETTVPVTTPEPIEPDDGINVGAVLIVALLGLALLVAIVLLTRRRPEPRRVVREHDRTMVLPQQGADPDATGEMVVYENLAYEELLAEAQAAGIPGRTSMTREELIRALRERG